MRGWSRELLMERHPYTAAVLGLLARIEETQGPAIAHAVETIFRSLKGGGILHVFGSRPSVSVTREALHRAGGLVPVNLIHEVMLSPLTPPAISGRMERVPGVAVILLDRHHLRARRGVVVISH